MTASFLGVFIYGRGLEVCDLFVPIGRWGVVVHPVPMVVAYGFLERGFSQVFYLLE